MTSENVTTVCHTTLLIFCVGAITALAYLDILHGGDGGALAVGLAAISAVGGFKLSNIISPIQTS